MRDNMLLTPAALATAAGQLWVSTAANAGAMRTPNYGHVTAAQTTGSVGTFVDLTTVGPAVTATTGISAITSHAAAMSNSTGGANAIMSYAVSGATTIAADATRCIRSESGTANAEWRQSSTHFVPNLTPGSNTFTAKYCTGSGGTASFKERHLLVFPL